MGRIQEPKGTKGTNRLLPLKEIDAVTGEVTFDDGTTDGTAGTKADCDAYGYNYANRKCYIPNSKKKHNTTNKTIGGSNKAIGQNIRIDGHKNIVNADNVDVRGNNHIVTGDNTVVTGHGGSAIRYGEEVHALTPHQDTVQYGNRGRAQRSILIYQGRTTGATETEIYLGGQDGERFIVESGYETVIGFEAKVLAKRVDINHRGAMTKFQHAGFRQTSGTLDRLGIQNKTNYNDGINGWTNDFVAVSGTPNYIKATVTGHNGQTIDWTIVLYVSEIRTNHI